MGPLPRSPLMEIVGQVVEVQLPALVVGHRGDSQNAPENTLRAFQLAIDAGAHMIELDVRLAGDGQVVVFHDERVDRTTDGHGEVQRMTTEELKELSAGSWFDPSFEAERIPTIDEMLDLCRGKTLPLIEIKDKKKKKPDVGVRIVEALRRHGMERQAVIICREVDRVSEVREASPQTPVAYLTVTKRQLRNAARIPGIGGVAPYWKSLSLRLVQQLRQASYFLVPWTVNRARDVDALLELGCEALISNSPVMLVDRIEGFEFARTEELHERFLRGDTDDVDLEVEEGREGESPEEVSRQERSDGDVAFEDPPEA